MSISSSEIKHAIENERIITHFQPIISLKSRRIVGVEALSRGLDSEGNIIPPVKLFEVADNLGLKTMLDRICRKTAMKNFSTFPNKDKLIMFMNLDASILDKKDHKSHHFTKNFAEEYDIPFSSMAVEIVESAIQNTDKLESAINNYRETGIMVVLDDFGADHSNLNRLIFAKPDIIKLDRELVHGVAGDYYKQAVVKSIKDMAEKIGAITLAEGVEEEEDVIACYKLGIDLYQGFYFAKPMPKEELNDSCCFDKIRDIADKIKENVRGLIELNRECTFTNENILGSILTEVSPNPIHTWYETFLNLVDKYPTIECMYILNDDGVQIGPTICNDKRKRGYGKLYQPSSDGTDHSLKDYYLFLRNLSIDRFYTDPYISMATGFLCRTMSRRFKIKDMGIIICVDFIDSAHSSSVI